MWVRYPEISEELILIENYIRKNTLSRNNLLSEIVGDLVESGGKRLRPALVVLCAKFGEYNREKVIPVAGSIEILHTATLVHDDIVDRSKIRRGKVTVSEKYGLDMAVYTGDFLFTKAVIMLSRHLPGDKTDMIAKGIKSICEGEVDQFIDRFNVDTSVMSYLKRINRKTAILFTAACALGASVSQCPDQITRMLARFGFCFGMAFQIRDDLNDFALNGNTLGKPVGNDISKGIITLPVIHVLRSDEKARKLITTVLKRRETLSMNEVIEIAALVKDRGGIEYSRKMLDTYIKRGIKSLDGLPDNICRQAMEDLIKGLSLDAGEI